MNTLVPRSERSEKSPPWRSGRTMLGSSELRSAWPPASGPSAQTSWRSSPTSGMRSRRASSGRSKGSGRGTQTSPRQAPSGLSLQPVRRSSSGGGWSRRVMITPEPGPQLRGRGGHRRARGGGASATRPVRLPRKCRPTATACHTGAGSGSRDGPALRRRSVIGGPENEQSRSAQVPMRRSCAERDR